MGARWHQGRRFIFLVFVCLSATTSTALAKEAASPDSESKMDPPEKSEADLMYEAMKQSGRGSNDDAAIDRALARAQRDSEKTRKALRQEFVDRSWKDPFVDDVVVPVRARRTARTDSEELRAARAEAARAKRATAMAQAEAALARADAARARADAARVEAVAARADAVAARQACVALPARDSKPRSGGGASHKSFVTRTSSKRYSSAGRRGGIAEESSQREVSQAAMTISTQNDSPPAPPPGQRPSGGIIIVPISPYEGQ